MYSPYKLSGLLNLSLIFFISVSPVSLVKNAYLLTFVFTPEEAFEKPKSSKRNENNIAPEPSTREQ